MGKATTDGTPLIVGFFHILPVYPGLGLNVSHVVEEALCQTEVAGYSIATCSCFTHPKVFTGLTGQFTIANPLFVVSSIGMGVPLTDVLIDAC